ncbi:MFS transporter [Siccirubricoccus phaeus]|uniref:MFS transporter n=1 Tax=Siccirubricoccus phaeus TaxID=2595053 RepID=UPI0011F32FEC|nr:MFS transporter [Siccirubricoccus phaeus]
MAAEPQAHRPAEGGGRSAFSPLKRPAFAVLWVATILGNTGTFMRDVASGWLVTELSAAPSAVAMIQVAGTLPVFLLAIPAGVLTDIVDRRRLLVGVQILLGGVSAALMFCALTGALTVGLLIGLTFLGGIGAALMGPAWQSIVPELVPKPDLRNAVALNSLGFNIARAIGPAVGGALLVAFGAATTYGADVASYAVVIAALLWWRRPAAAEDGLREEFGGAFRAGLRYARASAELRLVLLRAALFFLCASVVWALLPLVARQLLGGDAGFYGLLLAAVGAGAILGAVLLPRLRKKLDTDGVMLCAALGAAAVTALLAAGPPQALAVVLLLALGAAWIAALTTLNGTAQAILPNWVRGRGLAIYLMVFNGASALGSLAWGLVAELAGLRGTLLIGAAMLAAVALLARRLALPAGEADLTPSSHWPEPALAEPVAHDRGPVTVTIEYRVRAADRAAFLAAIGRLAPERRRDGAFFWVVSEDAADPERLVEIFMVESWAEHLRQHRRVSQADADLQAEVVRFHAGPEKPVVTHLLGV